MKKIRIPSLQHVARNWKDTPVKVQKTLVSLVKSPPTFTYAPLFGVVRDLLVLGVSYDQIVEGIKRGTKRGDVRENFLGILPLIQDHFSGITPDFVQEINRRYYPIARNIMVPFDPPMIYGVGGQICFPWFSFWRQNPLADKRLSLFITMVEELMLQDPDLDEARFTIMDFSAAPKSKQRILRVIDTQDIPRLPEAEKNEMLEIFAEGYLLAEQELSQPTANGENNTTAKPPEDEQPSFFDLL